MCTFASVHSLKPNDPLGSVKGSHSCVLQPVSPTEKQFKKLNKRINARAQSPNLPTPGRKPTKSVDPRHTLQPQTD